MLAFWRVMWYNRGTKYKRATAMTKAKRATRLVVREVERLCGGKYARILREVVREGNHATFAGVEQRATTFLPFFLTSFAAYGII